MRTLRLARVAAEAERLRLSLLIQRLLIRAAIAAVAVVFVLAALASAHFAGWLALVRVMPPVYAALVLLAVDLVIALVLALVASRGGPGAVEREAKVLRDTAAAELLRFPGLSTLTGPVGRMLFNTMLRLVSRRFARRRAT